MKSRRNQDTSQYPGLVVCDNRVSGSITAGASRLPLWGLTCYLFESWKTGINAEVHTTHGWTEQAFKSFLHHILDHRGEFARLICTLADVERRDTARSEGRNAVAWWVHPRSKQRVLEALRRCVYVLENDLGPWGHESQRNARTETDAPTNRVSDDQKEGPAK